MRVSISFHPIEAYDGATRLTPLISPAETIVSTYDADGELTARSDSFATLTYTYDSGGRLLTAATSSTGGQPSVTLTSGYDASSNRTSLADNLANAGVTTFAYDQASRMTTLTTSYGGTSGPQVVLGYDAADRMTSVARTIAGAGTAVTTSLAYDNADRVTSITHQISGGASIDALTYVYDSGGRLVGETNAEGSVTDSYDSVNQLTGVSGARAATYTYDSGGNRTMTGYATATGNETTSGGGYTYTYDNAGNLTAKTQASAGDVWAYSWDFRNRLTGVVERNSGGGLLMQGTYTYDGMNRRIGVDETVSGVETKTWSVYDGVNPYADFNGSGALQERYLHGPAVDEVLARTDSGGTTAWYLADKLGSIRDLANASGTVIDHVAYDAYGAVTSESSPTNGDRFKFTGQEYDAATGLYFYRARYYDPVTGRFLTPDPSGFTAGDTDLYRYVGNGPTNATDPTGLIDASSPAYASAMQTYQRSAQRVQQDGYAWSMAHQGTGGGPSFDLLDATIAFNQSLAQLPSQIAHYVSDGYAQLMQPSAPDPLGPLEATNPVVAFINSLAGSTIGNAYRLVTGELQTQIGENAYAMAEARGNDLTIPNYVRLSLEQYSGATSLVQGVSGYDGTMNEIPGSLWDGGQRTQMALAGAGGLILTLAPALHYTPLARIDIPSPFARNITPANPVPNSPASSSGTGAFLEGTEGGERFGRLANRPIAVSERGLSIVEQHLEQFGSHPPNAAMIERLRIALQSGEHISGADASFYMHEVSEATMMGRGIPYDIAHPTAIGRFDVSPFSVYHPDVIVAYPNMFGPSWRSFWNIQ